MKSSNILINNIKEFEGCKLTSYQDCAGVWTIGIGHISGVKMGQKKTMSQAESLLKGDLIYAEKYVNTIKEVDTQGKFDALVDFAFNLGIASLQNSTLLRKIKSKASLSDIQYEFKRWNKAGGKVQNGLVKRREWESIRWSQK